jgi:protein-tyrosine phosphatase
MFSIFKSKAKIPVNLSTFFTQDMHSHILPGIDDGAPDVATSLSLIKGMQHAGIKQFFGTPHIMAELHRNTKNTIEQAYQALKSALAQEGIDIPLHYAAEYMLDEGFLHHLNGGLLTLYNNYVLIETPFYQEPIDIEDVLFKMETAGYKGILAHPERYHYIDEKLKVLDKYIDRGFKLQLNFLALSGYYGPKERDVANKILDAGLYSFVGTDLHHERHLSRLSNMVLDKKVIKKIEKYDWKNTEITSAKTN